MRRIFTLLSFLVAFIAPNFSTAQSGQVWPGDSNDNGQVNVVDLLYWARAYGSTGPARPQSLTGWTAYDYYAWSQSFFGGSPNYAVADFIGDGAVDNKDFKLFQEIWMLEHGVVTGDDFQIDTTGMAPPLRLRLTDQALNNFSDIPMSVELGEEDNAVAACHGIVFYLSFRPNSLRRNNGIRTRFTPQSWLGGDPLAGQTSNSTGNDMPVSWAMVDSAQGQAQLIFTRRDGLNAGGFGEIGQIRLKLANDFPYNSFDSLLLRIDSVRAVNKNLQTFAVSVDSDFTGNPPNDCPPLIDPVCGSDGVTYINSCYAEAAGVYDYTPGTCFGDCIDPEQIDPMAECPAVYQPVCGCNGVTYANACEAEAAGVLSYSTGPCNDNQVCYDPLYVPGAAGTNVQAGTGIVTLSCPEYYDPVCGCNGVTYWNACVAEAAGITSYTTGGCDVECVDPVLASQYDEEDCENVYEPVCGCNDVTYLNECQAQAAGVTSWTDGPCGGSSAWCAEAVPVSCGDFLPNETTVGAGNQINYYPGCLNAAMAGPDRVYVIQKTAAGDLQIGLEITTPGLDLDLFLLADDCNTVTCIAKSTTNNQQTNNEGIILEDAPIGTYYIVVDGQYPNSAGQYRLEVSCGYLYCGDAVPLTCGETYSGSNEFGNDDVSLYACGNTLNVENNGPEIVHTFTISETQTVTAHLTNLYANLELFLLRECDRGECIGFSQNAGTANESITAELTPGTYFVVVDGYNGAISNYKLRIDCESSCDLSVNNIEVTASDCGGGSGSIDFDITGGTPTYQIKLQGPIDLSFTTNSDWIGLDNLPPGTYHLKVTDAGACTWEGDIVVPGNGGLEAELDPAPASCGGLGSLGVQLTGGQKPYDIYINGDLCYHLTANSNHFTINNLPPGDYEIVFIDANGCSFTGYFTIEQTAGDFSFVPTPTAASCGGYGSIHIATQAGEPPFKVTVTGPNSGSAITSATSFNIINLPGGVYTIEIEDANGCTHTEVVTVHDTGLMIDVNTTPESCGSEGTATLSIGGGSVPYWISWTGPENGSVSTNNPNPTITGLPAGNYTFTVESNNGCTDHQTATVEGSDDENLDLTVSTVQPATCTAGGKIKLLVVGVGPFSVAYDGPVSGTLSGLSTVIQLDDLPAGTYWITVTGSQGCSAMVEVDVPGQTGEQLDLNLWIMDADCNNPGSLEVTVGGGSGPFTVTWDGPESGSADFTGNTYTIYNLDVGTYTISVTNGQSCTGTEIGTIGGSEDGVDLVSSLIVNDCGQYTTVWNDLFFGVPPYNVEVTRLCDNSIYETFTTNEALFELIDLPPCDYKIKVTDANGCMDMETVTIASGDLLTAEPLPGVCDANGKIKVTVDGTDEPFHIEWSGPVSGVVDLYQSMYFINDLPSGTYTITLVTGSGCQDTEVITLDNSASDLDLVTSLIYNDCGQYNTLWNDINGGTPPFTITVTKLCDNTVLETFTTDDRAFELMDLPPCQYKIKVTDANGCMDMETRTVQPEDLITATPYPGTCDELGWISATVSGGTAPYTIQWTGPVSGTLTQDGETFIIPDLPSGTYTISYTSSEGCTDAAMVTLENADGDLDLVTSLIVNDCGQYNTLWNDIEGGTPPFLVEVTKLCDDTVLETFTTDSREFELMDLPPCQYKIKITDANGCMDMETRTVHPSDLITVVPQPSICDPLGSIQVMVSGGTAPFTLNYSGPIAGTLTQNEQVFSVPDLPSGTYTFSYTSSEGCTDSETATLENGTGSLDLVTSLIVNDCGEYNTFWNDIFGGTPPFTVEVTRLCDDTVLETFETNEALFELLDLPPCDYKIKVTDANGCMDMETRTVEPSDLITVTPQPGACDQPGSVTVTVLGGTGPFTLTYTGPANGTLTQDEATFTIDGLPSGEYTFSYTSSEGCSASEVATLSDGGGSLDLVTSLIVNDCGQYNTLWNDIFGGTAPFTVEVTKLCDGTVLETFQTNEPLFELMDLPPCDYKIKVTDANGCMDMETRTVEPSDLIAVTPAPGTCDQPGSVTVVVSGGTAPYTLDWTGPVSGTLTQDEATFLIDGLPSGEYTFSYTSSEGCTDSETIDLDNGVSTGLELLTSLIVNDCGQYNTLWNDIEGGTPPFTVVVTKLCDNTVYQTFETSTREFELMDLPPCEYKVKVTDATGCMDMETRTIYPSEINLVTTQVSAASCNADGAITLNFSNGAGNYTGVYNGPVDGTISSDGTEDLVLSGLPAGTYDLTITENGADCTQQLTVTVTGEDNVVVDYTVSYGGCSGAGKLTASFPAAGDYTVSYTGPVSGTESVVDAATLEIAGLPAGTYDLTATADGAGDCSTSQSLVVESQPGSDLIAQLAPQNGSCGGAASILVSIFGGQAPYTVAWTRDGDLVGQATINMTTYLVPGLVGGDYTVEVTDDLGCSQTLLASVAVGENELTVDPTILPASCGSGGMVGLSFVGGTAPYAITYDPGTGPVTVTADQNSYMITGLPPMTYSLSISDAGGCSNEVDIEVPGTTDGTPYLDFSLSRNNLTVLIENNSANGTYSWTFGDEGTSALREPTFTFSAPGSYEICLTLAAPCGTVTACETVDVEYDNDDLMIEVGDMAGTAGSTILVPVYLHNAPNLVSIAGSIVVGDSDLAQIVGTVPAAISPQFNMGNYTFSFIDNSGQGINTLNETIVLFYLEVLLNGLPGQSTYIDVMDQPLPIEVAGLVDGQPLTMPYTTESGEISIIEAYATVSDIEVDVETYWGEGIPQAELYLAYPDGEEMTMMSDDEGLLMVPDLPTGQSYQLSMAKNSDPANGLSTYGLFIGQRFILGLEPQQITSPYQIVAGDANCNDAFTTLDLFLIQQLIIGTQAEFADCPSWVFAHESSVMPEDFDAYNVFPYVSQAEFMPMSDTLTRFIGVKVGDILGQANPAKAWEGPGAKPRYADSLTFRINAPVVAAGTEVEVVVNSDDFTNVASYQYQLWLDPDQLEYLDIEVSEATQLKNLAIGAQRAADGLVRLSWFSTTGEGVSATAEDELFTIRLRSKTAIEDWSGVIGIEEDGFPSEAYNGNLEQLGVVLEVDGVVPTREAATADGFRLYQNTPNPFRSATAIEFDLPERLDAELRLYDHLGRLVKTWSGNYPGGHHRIELQDADLAAGVYHYQLTAGAYRASRSMVVID